MAITVGDVAHFRAISRRLKMYGFDPEQLDEEFQGMLEGMFGSGAGKELYDMLLVVTNPEFVEIVAETAIDSIHLEIRS